MKWTNQYSCIRYGAFDYVPLTNNYVNHYYTFSFMLHYFLCHCEAIAEDNTLMSSCAFSTSLLLRLACNHVHAVDYKQSTKQHTHSIQSCHTAVAWFRLIMWVLLLILGLAGVGVLLWLAAFNSLGNCYWVAVATYETITTWLSPKIYHTNFMD